MSTIVKKGTSSYIGVAGELRSAILSGRYAPGSRLPAERAMELKRGVSRVTIRRALRVLEEERLVQRRQGSGTYVSPKPTRRIPLMIDYTGSMRDHAPALRRRVVRWRRQPAGSEAAEALGIRPDDEVFCAERVDKVAGATVACDRAYIVASFAEHLTERDLSCVDFVETWTRRGRFSIETCRQTIEAVSATDGLRRALGLSHGRPVLKSTELYLAEHGRPAGLFISFYHPEHICIASRYHWAGTATVRRHERMGLT